MSEAMSETYEVGGLRLRRPFRIRRLGHFGLNVSDVGAALSFYGELLGFRASDPLDFAPHVNPDQLQGVRETVGWFLRHASDHHSFVVFPRRMMEVLAGGPAPESCEVTVNQITWQVGSLREVVDAAGWFARRSVPILRSGRDTPGSNWHVYVFDPAGHVNELYYGIEQIGWNGRSKPRAMFESERSEIPSLPQPSELSEVEAALAKGIDLASGHRGTDAGPAAYEVGGVLLPRPFKIVRVGPVRLFVADVESVAAFYQETLGLTLTEELVWHGHRCLFLRASTEHHSIALYPRELRSELGLSPHTTLMAFGAQVGDYRQLREAVAFLRARGVTVRYLDPGLFPGIDYSALAMDPDGHAIQLYYYMEQIGWDGRPRPAGLRRQVSGDSWPLTLDPMSDSFAGEPFLGPLG